MRPRDRFIATSFLFLKASLLVVLAASPSQAQNESVPKKLLLSHILIKISDVETGSEATTKTDLARSRAEEVLKAARSGTSFASLAARYSDDPATADIGGSLGWVRRGQLAPSLEEVAFQLKVGEISEIVQSDFGFHVLRLVAVADDREPVPPSPPKFSTRPAPPADALPQPSRPPVPRWPDANNPRDMGVGKTISELRGLCSQNSGQRLHGTDSSSHSSEYECAIVAIQMDPDYEQLVDRIVTLRKQECRLNNGDLISEAPADPVLARVWRELQPLVEDWERRAAAISDDNTRAEGAEAKEREDADAEVARQIPGYRTRNLSEPEKILKQQLIEKHQAGIQERKNSRQTAGQRALRLALDFWRVNGNCGKGV
jgi:PPIC-type PPIASE domain